VTRVLRRAVAWTFAATASVALVVAALVAAWLAGVRIPIASGATYLQVVKVSEADAAGGPGAPFFIMLIGSDFRPGVGGARGDALHVVGVNPALGRATILNIPRDVCTSAGKINNGHARGGPRGQADLASEVVGVPIHYAISVDFAGFDSIVNAMGGVEVDVPAPMDDPFSGAYFAPGRLRMNGAQALAFARDRHDFPRGDIQRSENQGSMLLSGFRQLQEEADDVAGEMRLVVLLARHAQLDGVGLADLYRLGRVAQALDPDGVRNVTMPVVNGGCSGGLRPSADAAALFADFGDDGVLQQH